MLRTNILAKLNDLKAILLFDLKAMFYPVLLLPVVIWAVVAAAICGGYLPHAHSPEGEKLYVGFDDVALYVLWAAVAVAVVRLAVQRHAYFLWLAGLVGTLLIREYHFEWANIYAHIALPVLLTAGWLWYASLSRYFTARVVVTLVGLGLFCYVLSQSLDQRWWARVLPRERDWEKVVEELLEIVGHLVFMALTLLSHARSKSASPVAMVSGPADLAAIAAAG